MKQGLGARVRSETGERSRKGAMLVSGKLAERWSKILVVRIVGELSLDGKVFLQDGFLQARLFIQALLLLFSTISPPIAPPLFDGAMPNVQKIYRIPVY